MIGMSIERSKGMCMKLIYNGKLYKKKERAKGLLLRGHDFYVNAKLKIIYGNIFLLVLFI